MNTGDYDNVLELKMGDEVLEMCVKVPEEGLELMKTIYLAAEECDNGEFTISISHKLK